MRPSAVRLGVVMDPIWEIKPIKDSTLAMLLAAQRRGWELIYMEMGDLLLRDGAALAHMRPVEVRDDLEDWCSLEEGETQPLGDLDVVLMRKDPPFDLEYIYATYVLERAQEQGALVVNHPRALRDANEKAYLAWFPQCCPPTLITRSESKIREFLAEQTKIVVKPLDGMGGKSIFVLEQGGDNVGVVLETMTDYGGRFSMAQRFIPEIRAGDKRILLIDGEAVPFALARIPAEGESRGNLAVGATSQGRPLSDRDRWIAAQVAPGLRKLGVVFAGLDVIGDYLTEINITSPTCIRELDREFDLDIAGDLMGAIEARLTAQTS